MEELILEDKKAMIFLNNLGNSSFDQFWILISEKWFWIPLYVIFLYFLFKNFNKKSFFYILLFIAIGVTVSDHICNIFKSGFNGLRNKWIWLPFYVINIYLLYKNFNKKYLLYILILIVLCITVSDQVAIVLKDGFHRLRPCHDPSLEGLLREVKCGGKFGFYSAHSSNSFFVATYLTMLLGKKIKQLPYFLFVWAAIVAYSRVYLGMHFPGDIIVGASMGILLALFCGTLAKKVIKKSEVTTQDS